MLGMKVFEEDVNGHDSYRAENSFGEHPAAAETADSR